ncbi:Na-translocating system protein MpsC family protein [Metabacillus endolithicus]|uniref:Na-translocating system protein MpsC family protein n=1 Tax=Metabacillus endolithicus TaxID=1535204 RepID=A0ABW5C6H9_9BACI|nr:Na-translocating system protein MpsC family protein [Metabacillus endolithicus]UPG62048.1 DUF2294 domain-containing protein [Metabacillus endolithicus]
MDQETLNMISSFTSKLLRKNFGKGPQSCQSTLCGKYLVTYIRGFISPMEEILIQQGQNNQVDKARTVIINHIIEELKGVVKITFDRDVEESYHDWNFPNNSGVIIFVMDDEVEKCASDQNVDFKRLETEVARLSQLVQKIPDQIYVYPLSSSLYLIERKGILIPIEKSLIKKGFAEELKITKDELEKTYFHRYGKFDDIFNTTIKDIFIDWNFKEDKSFVAFILGS